MLNDNRYTCMLYTSSLIYQPHGGERFVCVPLFIREEPG